MLAEARKVEQLRLDIDKIRWSKSVPSESTKSRLSQDLLDVVTGKGRPPTADVTKLAEDLAAAVSHRPNPRPETSELVISLKRVMNAAHLTSSEVDRAVSDCQRILKAWRVPSMSLTTVITDMKTLVADTQAKTKKTLR